MTSFDQLVPAPTGRVEGITRGYGADEVRKLRGSLPIEHSLARHGANKLWELLQRDAPVRALGAVTGNQAMQMVRAGLEAIYLSGWQVAADANTAGAMYPNQSRFAPPSETSIWSARWSVRLIRRASSGPALAG